MKTITWVAKNNSSSVARREEKSMRAAVRAARYYVENEMFGEGTITICADGLPVREDEKSIFTGLQWQTRML